VKSRGGNRAVLLQTALSTGVSDRGGKLVQSMQAAGVEYTGVVNYTPNADSPAATAARIVESTADTVLAVTESVNLIKILNELRAAGHSPKVVLATNGYDTQLLRDYGAGMSGIVIPLFYRPFEAGGPAIANYTDAMARFAPQIQEPERDFPLMSFIQTDMFIEGLELAGDCPTRQSFIDGLRSVTNYDADGLIQPIDIKTGLGKQNLCYAFVQANAAGNAFDVVEENFCGMELVP
jgi:branched-chain amino acid transport system substrate-binding protein